MFLPQSVLRVLRPKVAEGIRRGYGKRCGVEPRLASKVSQGRISHQVRPPGIQVADIGAVARDIESLHRVPTGAGTQSVFTCQLPMT